MLLLESVMRVAMVMARGIQHLADVSCVNLSMLLMFLFSCQLRLAVVGGGRGGSLLLLFGGGCLFFSFRNDSAFFLSLRF